MLSSGPGFCLGPYIMQIALWYTISRVGLLGGTGQIVLGKAFSWGSVSTVTVLWQQQGWCMTALEALGRFDKDRV
jgi:hypothetical protein